jgi:hypothetical protein
MCRCIFALVAFDDNCRGLQLWLIERNGHGPSFARDDLVPRSSRGRLGEKRL